MNAVFALDTEKRPQLPVHPAVARRLLSNGQAAVWRRHPFTIILHTVLPATEKRLRVKIDPGSKTTGLAVVDDAKAVVLWAGELTHKGQEVKNKLDKRRALRRSRRSRKTRYRAPRFDNRRRPEGWLAPSLLSRVHNLDAWLERLRKYAPIGAFSVENVRFDTQKLRNAEISGVEYQQGTLFGYELREYLLEKWERKCAYCRKSGMALEIEHITPKSRGGSNRVDNLTLSCRPCNVAKGNKTAAEFGFPGIQKFAQLPLKDAAWSNSTRNYILAALANKGLPVETGTGGRTKFNRTRAGLDKSHWADAACVGESTPEQWRAYPDAPLLIAASGTGSGMGRRQFVKMDKNGFPRKNEAGKARLKRRDGFGGGDLVRADIPKGKNAGVHIGKISFRAKGSFALLSKGKNISVSPRHLTLLSKGDKFSYGNG